MHLTMKHQYLKQNLIEVKRGIVKYIIMREFNTPLPIIDSSGSTRLSHLEEYRLHKQSYQ